MKLKDMQMEELELLSYTDLAYMLLKEKKKKMNTPQIFKTICELLELSEDEYASKIGDYYTSLTTDKRFTLLENAEWDLKDNHKLDIVLDEEDDEDSIFEDEEESDEEESEETEEDMDESIEITDDEIDLDDDMEDLSIVSDEAMEEVM